jgi:uncharacterized membrane protein YjjB (DUF3815 family)
VLALPVERYVMTPVAYLIERRRSGPPAFATFLPGFWLLVPGSAGLVGLAKLVGTDGTTGIRDTFRTVVAIVAVALGSLCGYLRSTAARSPCSGGLSNESAGTPLRCFGGHAIARYRVIERMDLVAVMGRE